MSAFKFIKSHKSLTNSNSNVQVPFDNDLKSKNVDNFNNAPAQPAQSFNISEPKINQPQQKKGFNFIKRKPNPNNVNNILEQSNTSINSREQNFSGNNNNNYNSENDLNSLINNTNELLNFGAIQKNEENFNNSNIINNNNNDDNNNNNLNINTLGEATYQNFGNIEEDSSNIPKKETYFNNNLNFIKPDFAANNNINNNFEEREKVVEKPKEKKSGFSFVNRKNKKKNNNNINNSSESDSNKNIPYIANKTPLSSSMSDKLSDKGSNQGYMNINQEAAETEKELINNNKEYYMDMNSLNNSNSNNNINVNEANNNTYNLNKKNETFTPEKKEEIKEKENEISEIGINSKYKIKKDYFINDYIKYVNELHSKKLQLQNKELELSSLNVQKENLIKEEQKAIDDNDYEKADNIENKIKDIKNKSNEILLKIEEAKKMVSSVDSSGDGEVDFEEFVMLMEKHIHNLSDDPVLQAFREFDKNDDGKITNYEFRYILTHVGENKFSDKEVDELFKDCELKDEDEIEYENFILHWRKQMDNNKIE